MAISVKVYDAASGLVTSILPAQIATAEQFSVNASAKLFPEEARLVARAVDSRKNEFATVRFCARDALSRLGIAPTPIVPIDNNPEWARRAPRWPKGIVGSMTHCEGYYAAAAARDDVIASLGVDAEPNRPLPNGVNALVTLPSERILLDNLAASYPGVAWDRLFFSAKESVYKAWYPLTGRWLDFSDCSINPDLNNETFTATLRVRGPVVAGIRLKQLNGWWRVVRGSSGGHVATGTAVSATKPNQRINSDPRTTGI